MKLYEYLKKRTVFKGEGVFVQEVEFEPDLENLSLAVCRWGNGSGWKSGKTLLGRGIRHAFILKDANAD